MYIARENCWWEDDPASFWIQKVTFQELYRWVSVAEVASALLLSSLYLLQNTPENQHRNGKVVHVQ